MEKPRAIDNEEQFASDLEGRMRANKKWGQGLFSDYNLT